MNEKRNSEAEIAQFDLFPGPIRPGVGARRADGGDRGRGGGYQDICGSENVEGENLPEDPRFEELRRMGLPRAWLMVAERVGFDAWLDVWRMLSDAEFDTWIRRDTGGTRMPELRPYCSYLRYQRNRYIDALAARGLSAAEIRQAVAKNLREMLDEKHVLKIMKKR